MKRLAGVILLAAAALASAQQPVAQPEKAAVTRTTIEALEKAFDTKVLKISATDPMDVLSSTQGVYLKGFGVVFTAQLDLIMTPALSPFRQVMTKPEIARVRARKIDRLPVLKLIMREMLMETAAKLPEMPPGENVVLAVTLFRVRWEDTEGLPAQIVMQAPKQKLVNRAAADSAIQLQEF